MSVDIETIGVGVDSSGVIAGKRNLDAFGQSADTASKKADSFGKSGTKAAKNTDTLAKSANEATGYIRTLATAMLSLGAASSLIRTIDEYTKLTAQLRLATRTLDEYAAAFNNVKNISNVAQTALGETAVLYARLSNATRELGANQTTVAAITETVALSLKVSGATAAEAASTMLQFSQAMGKGKLNSEEFNSVAEAAPRLMRALADGLGVPIGRLKELADDGKLTADIVGNSLIKSLNDLRHEAEQMRTIGGAFTLLKNEILLTVGALDSASGAGRGFAQLIEDFAKSGFIRTVFETIAVLGVEIQYVFKQVGNEIGGMAAQLAAFLSMDFKRAGEIHRMMAEDAKKARIEQDKLVASIMNPKVAKAPVVEEIKKLAPAVQAATEESKKLAKERERLIAQSNAMEEAERNRMKSMLEQDERALEAGKRLIEQQNEAIEALQKQAIGWDDLTQAEQAAWDIQNGKFKDFDAQSKEEILRLSEMIDLKQKIADLEKSNMEDARRIEDDMVNETLAGMKKRADEHKKMWESIDSVAHDTFVSIFDSGKNTFDRLRDTLKNGLYDLLYQMTIKKWIINVSAAVSGGGAGGAAAGDLSSLLGGGGSGGSGGFGLGSIKSVFDVVTKGFDAANNLFVGAINDFGASVANMGGVFSDVGGWIGQYSGTISAVAPFVPSIISILSGDIKGGIASGIGAGIGFAIGGPIGGAIGSALGSFVGGMFGKKSPPMVGSQAAGTFSNGKYSGTFGQYGKKDIGAGSSLNDLNKAFATKLGTLLKSFGLNDRVSANSIYRNRTVTKGFFGASFDGGSFYSMISKKEDFQTYINKVLGQELVKAIQMSKLPDGIRALFNGMTDKTQVTNMIQASMNLNGAQEQLAERFGITVNEAAKVSKVTGAAGDQLIAFVNNLAGAANAFKTAGEVLLDAKADLTEAFGAGGGGSLPATLNDFDAILKSIDTSTAAGIKQFADLFQLRGGFMQFTQAIDSLKGGVKGSIFGLSSPGEQQAMMQADLAQLFGSLNLQIPGSVQELINLGKSIDYTTEEGLNLAAVFPSLVSAFVQAREQTDALVNSLQSLDTSRFANLVDYTRAVRYAESGIDISKLPAYADGGSFSGGLRLVGERGPELEITGPSRIMSNDMLRQSLSGNANSGAIVAAINALGQQLREEIRAGLYAVATNTGETAKRIRKWDGDGLPAERVIA